MAWVAVDASGCELITSTELIRTAHWMRAGGGGVEGIWMFAGNSWAPAGNMIMLPKGTIRKILGRDITWKDEPVELKDGE